MIVACAVGLVDGPAQALQPGVGGPRRQRGATRLEQRRGDSLRGHPSRRLGGAPPCCAAQRRCGLDAQLATEQLLGLLDVSHRRRVRAGGDEALDEQHVGPLVERRPLNTDGGQLDGAVRIAGRQLVQHGRP
jgi:hypothetical protein